MHALVSRAEQHAVAAQDLPVFAGFNLLGVKNEIAQALALIRTNGLFREYTLHDISHIEKMLMQLDYLVPSETAEPMSPADWLLLTLGIYFHDLGLVVTEDEFASRDRSNFTDFCKANLFAGDDGAEYQSKVATLGDQRDRFLYQEFVREHHAQRIGDWIRGTTSSRRGISSAISGSVTSILAPLPSVFREDLATICESHHLHDLDDVHKYPPEQPYGDSAQETANVQYAAIMLRSADLLHITQDRTPSTMFRLINPQNPLSQREWAKQMAVRQVRPQKGRDRDGNFSNSAPKDTIEIFAKFSDADGFFGLSAYLRYAERQLRQCHDWARATKAQFDIPHDFPWKKLDDSGVTAEGFLPERLGFSLDQERILDLLTGHTLYNDTSVVLRELVQNSIDAVRLQALLAATDSDDYEGLVEITWDKPARMLVVRDNGTGMSQHVIENNLLKAGASRYHEEEFKKRHSAFSPISNFGIGVLSAFMIADSVEIITCAPEEIAARTLVLRSVHDRYLIRLLDKETSPEVVPLLPHGTEVRLNVRETAQLGDVVEILQHWIVVPRCKVVARVDDETPVPIGFSSCKEAVESSLVKRGFTLYDGVGEPSSGAVRVMSKSESGVETAFAVVWNSYFKEWAVQSIREIDEAIKIALGSCVEGIRVEATSAGFVDDCILGLCNATGHQAPKTNVARSGLEATTERGRMMRRVYGAYCAHIAAETQALVESRGFSSTWAAQEAEVLIRPIFVNRNRRDGPQPIDAQALADAVAAQPLLIIEDGASRRLASARSLAGEPRLWTIDSAFVRSTEGLLREVPSDSSLLALASALDTEAIAPPDGVTLVGFKPGSRLYRTALAGREVRCIAIRQNERRLDLAWDLFEGDSVWMDLDHGLDRSSEFLLASSLFVGRQDLEVRGRQGETAVRAHGCLMVFADTSIAQFVQRTGSRLPDPLEGSEVLAFLGLFISQYMNRTRPPDNTREWLDATMGRTRRTSLSQLENNDIAEIVDLDELALALDETPLKILDPSAWRRGDADVE